MIGGQSCSILANNSSGIIRVKVPALSAGNYDIVLTDSNGTFTASGALTTSGTITTFYAAQTIFATSGFGGPYPSAAQLSGTATANGMNTPAEWASQAALLSYQEPPGSATGAFAAYNDVFTYGGALNEMTCVRGFVTEELFGVTSIPAMNWTFGCTGKQGFGSAYASFDKLCIYIWRPSTSSLVGKIYDNTSDNSHPSGTILNATWTLQSIVFTFAGSAVAGMQDGDILVLEWYGCGDNTHAQDYDYICWNGSTSPGANGSTPATDNIATYLSSAQSIFAPANQSYTQNVQGGVVLGGSSDIVGQVEGQTYTQNVQGGVVLGGRAIVAHGAIQAVQGGMVLGGSSDILGWSPFSVAIMAGAYQIGSTVYTLAASVLTVLGMVGAVAYLEPPPAAGSGLYRYDVLSINAAGAITVTTGTPASIPVMPATPANQDLLGCVLMYPGMASITQKDIGKLFSAPATTRITASASLSTMTWSEATSTITVTVLDQNGQALSGTYTIMTSFARGNGAIAPVNGSIAGGSSCVFTYTRGQASGDQSPILTFALQSGYNPLTATIFITLLDASGNIMM
jgi:hypothetical protein